MKDVSIIIPLHNPDKNLLKKILKSIKSQNYSGKVSLIKINEGKGLAESLNIGIKKSRTPIIISLHQDCLPSSNNWLANLTKPLQKKDNLVSVSKVELPFSLWSSFDGVSKILSVKEQAILTPLMDEKGCAYKKELFSKAGLFNEKDYRTAGEDFDMYLKIKRHGKIAYPDAKVYHYHNYTWKKRLRKEYQLSNAFGALFRNNLFNLPKWYIGITKAIPFLGYLLFLPGINPKKIGYLSLPAILLYFPVSLIYSIGFWQGFIKGRQTV